MSRRTCLKGAALRFLEVLFRLSPDNGGGQTEFLFLALAIRLGPWVGATAASWPRAHTLVVAGTSITGQLPQFEAWLGAGLTFGRGN